MVALLLSFGVVSAFQSPASLLVSPASSCATKTATLMSAADGGGKALEGKRVLVTGNLPLRSKGDVRCDVQWAVLTPLVLLPRWRERNRQSCCVVVRRRGGEGILSALV